MTLGKLAGAAVGAALVVRVARSRHQRFMHPAGRSFAGVFTGLGGDHDATIRISKGVGTRGGRADVRGLAIRVHLPGRDLDLLFSTAGHGPVGRHLPVPRRSFDTGYGSITGYRIDGTDKAYLSARVGPDGPPLGRSLATIVPGTRFVLLADDREFARASLGGELPPPTDEALAFDPVRNSLPDLHPTGLIHSTRAAAYRLSQRWRGATPASPNPAAVARVLT